MAEQLRTGGVTAKDIKIDKIEPRKDAVNLAEDEEIVVSVKNLIQTFVTTQESLLTDDFRELEYYDYMFRCGRNATQKELNKPVATGSDPRSDVGASMFFRQVMQSAAKTYSLQHGRDAFFKYTPISTAGVPYSDEDGRLQAEQMNTLSRWNLKQICFDERTLMPLNITVAKLGLAIIVANWKRERRQLKFTLSGTIDETSGEAGDPTPMEVDTLVKNQMEFVLKNVSACRFDPTITGIQNQECFSMTDVISFGDIVNMVKLGYWSEQQFALLTQNQGWDGRSGNLLIDTERENAGGTAKSNTDTGKYLQWRVWVNLPIEESKMDSKTIIPVRYVCDFIGNTISDAVCMRIERNDDPDDEIPAEVIYDYPDTEGNFFHISKGHVLKSNYAVETTVTNQMMDNISLVNNPPTIERKSAMVSRPKKWGRGARFVVRNSVNDDFKEFLIRDPTQTGLMILEHIKSDSQMAIHTDPAQMGEGLGARATATEASGVMKLSAAPSVMNAQYITKQLFGWMGPKMASYWKAYSLSEQVIRITDSDSPIQDIKPTHIYAQFDVEVDVVDEVVSDIMEENKLSQDLQLFVTHPNLAAMVDVKGLLEEYFIRRYKKSYVSGEVDFDARSMAQHENDMMMREGKPATVVPTQNHRIHLEIHRAEKIRYMGVQDEYPQVQLIDSHIASHEQAMDSASSAAPPQQAAQPAAPAAPALPNGAPPNANPNVAGGKGVIPAKGLGGGTPPTVGAVTQKAVAQ